MKSLARIAVLAAMLPYDAVASPPPSQVARAQSATNLTVSVFNDARLPEKVAMAAEERASYIFLRAGVEVTWLDCGTRESGPSASGCSHISFPEHLSLRIVAGGARASEDTFGQSFLNSDGEGSYANIYWGTLRASSANSFLREGDLLGNVFAHEIGHLLLGANSHGSSGIMCARWQRGELEMAAKGLLLFTTEEARRMGARYRLAVARNKPKEESKEIQTGD